MDSSRIRSDFPVLKTNPNLVYFDNACTTLKPQSVISAMSDYYTTYSACAGRSNHALSKKVDEALTASREKVAKFVNGSADSLVFTRNTTEALNLVVSGLDYSKRPHVVTSNMEHHSLLLPLQRLAQEKKIELKFAMADEAGRLSAASFASLIDSRTALVAIHHTTNTTGASPPLREITKLAHDAGARILIDGAQGVAHSPIDLKREGWDYLAFSGHKMCGPTGIGALAAKPDALESVRPLLIGGETILTATLTSHVPLPAPKRFEAGIQHYEGIIGLAAACGYLKKVGMENIHNHEKELAVKLESVLLASGATIYGPAACERASALIAFNFPKLPSHDVSGLLDQTSKIAVRSGMFCAQPAVEHLGAAKGAVRASLYLYNTADELNQFAAALSKIKMLA